MTEPSEAVRIADLVRAMRDPDYAAELQHLRSWSEIDSLFIRGASQIEALSSALAARDGEIARLRAALEPFVRYAEAHGRIDNTEGEIGEVYRDGLRVSIRYSALRTARAALSATRQEKTDAE